MDFTKEAIEFIDSETIKKYLRGKELPLSVEDAMALVWNSNSDLDSKQTFLMSLQDERADELVKRFESTRKFLAEKHDGMVYVLIINDKFLGVYDLFDTARADFEDFRDSFGKSVEISLELYLTETSTFMGRIKLSYDFEITGFDFSLSLIEDEKLWNPDELREIINRYIPMPHPYRVGDIVSLTNSLDTFKVIDSSLPTPDEELLNYSDIAIKVIRCDEDGETDEADEPEMVHLFEIEL